MQGISSLGGLAPNPVSEWAGRNADAFLDNSITQDLEQKLAEKYNPSQGAQNVTGIGQAIVQMLPGIGASKVVSAAGKGLNAAQALSRGENVGRALFGIQAAGNAASQAKAEGADTGRALAFGAASGALETAIEGIAGGIRGLGGGKVGPRQSRPAPWSAGPWISQARAARRRFPPFSPLICSGPFMTRTPPTPHRRRLRRVPSWARWPPECSRAA